jgi:hypothetical protein
MHKDKMAYFQWIFNQEQNFLAHLYRMYGGYIDSIILPSPDNNNYIVNINPKYVGLEEIRTAAAKLHSKFTMLPTIIVQKSQAP